MKRNMFFAALTGVLTLPNIRTTKYSHLFAKPVGFVTRAGEGRYHGHIRLKGVNHNIMDVKVSGKDTNGGLAIFEQTGLSPKHGVPLHIHPNQDEVFQILEGEYHFLVNNIRYELKKGDTIFLPKNEPHAWVQISERGRMTVLFQPAGKIEEFFVTMATLEHEPAPQEIAKIFSDHDMKVVGPPMQVG